MAKNPAATLEQMMLRRMNRRELLKTGVSVGAGAVSALGLAGCSVSSVAHLRNKQAEFSSLGFEEIHKSSGNSVVIPRGYRMSIVARWGDLLSGKDDGFDAQQLTPASQARRVGYNNDYLAYLPLDTGVAHSGHGLLHINHEYTIKDLMFSDVQRKQTPRDDAHYGKIEQQAQGFSVIEIRRNDAENWRSVASRYARRVTATTPIRISGAAAGDKRMCTRADVDGETVLGTFANCAGGVTPWGTVLTCEENIDSYFANLDKDNPQYRAHARMRIAKKTAFSWHHFDERFDVSKEPNEPNRFGWVVEYDPYDPHAMPVKRTALGRCKHESATCAVTPEDKVVVYTGDDEAFQYLYRFVSHQPINRAHKAANKDILDEGILYVAKFYDDGTMRWLPLVYGAQGLTAENGFYSQADVLIETRYAADIVGATPLDRPEDIEVHPTTGRVYVSLTKNPARKAGDTNKLLRRAPNPYGLIVELIPPTLHEHVVHDAQEYRWEVFLQGGNPQHAADESAYHPDVSAQGWLTNPDNLACDTAGRLWIATDGQADVGWNDGLYATDVIGKGRALTRMFLSAPKGAEVTGPCFTPDATTLFVSIQHPASAKDQALVAHASYWPDFNGHAPRPAVIAITKEDGGVIGS